MAPVQPKSPPISAQRISQQYVPRGTTISPPPPSTAGSLKWLGIVMAVAVVALFVWKSINRTNIQSTPAVPNPSVQFARLDGKIIGTLSPLTSIPSWLQNITGGRAISPDNFPPPGDFQIRDRCAGEGCGYQRHWRALKEVPLFATWD